MKILKFGAGWCAACIALQPTLDVLAAENPKHEFITKDVDIEPDASEAVDYALKSLPTVIFLDNKNQEIFRFIGNKTKKYIQDVIDELQETHTL